MNKKDFKEFADFATKQFSKIIEKLEYLGETKADKADVQRIVDEVIGKKTDEILSTMDRYAKESSDQKQEHDFLVRQVNRHDKWINKIALKTDTKLDY